MQEREGRIMRQRIEAVIVTICLAIMDYSVIALFPRDNPKWQDITIFMFTFFLSIFIGKKMVAPPLEISEQYITAIIMLYWISGYFLLSGI